MKEAGCHKQGSNAAVTESRSYDKVVGVLEKLSSSVIDYWKREEEAELIQCLDTPDRKGYAKEQLALHLAKACLKHAKLEKEMAFAEAPPKMVD